MTKKLATAITIMVLLLVLAPVYAQEETPPAETPPTEEVPPTDEPSPEGTPSTDEPSPEETPSPAETPLAEETPSAETPSPDETPPPEGELFLVDLTIPEEVVCDLDVIVQRDDWLSKLSEKFYGNILAFPAIYVATNIKAAEDDTYTIIEDPDLIEPGWKLCIVGVETAELILGFELDAAPLVDETPQNLIDVIKVGGAHALSGLLADQGQSIKSGIDIAVKEINETAFLGAGSIEVIWEDTAGDRVQATNAFNKLIDEDEVVAIVGPTLSRSAFPADSVAQLSGVPVIGSSNTAGGITAIGNNIFRTNLSDAIVIRNTVERTKELLGLKKVAMMYDNSNAVTKANHNAFEQALSDEEIEVIATVAFANGATDLSAQLSEIQTLNPDAIVLNALSQDAANIIFKARQLGIPDNVRFIGGSSINSSIFLQMGSAVANGTVSGAAWNADINSGSNRTFVSNYEAEYGSRPDQFAAQSYTAMWALANALRNADSTDRTAIRDALDALDLIESPLGLFTFDDSRNPDHAPVLQVVNDGAFLIFQ